MAKPSNPRGINPETDVPEGEDLGVFDPEAEGLPTGKAEPYTIPQLVAFRDDPTKESHLAAAKLLHRTGPLVLDGRLYALAGGRVAASEVRRDYTRVVPDDPREVVV